MEPTPTGLTEQLAPHHAERVDLPGAHGPIAALRADPGPADRGVSAVLLPGYTGSKEDFAELLDPLAAAGFEVIAIDLPGQYESPGPIEEHEYLPGALGPVLAEVLAKLSASDRTIYLLGHSYGGLVARATVLAGAEVGMLALLDTGPGGLPAGGRRELLNAAEPLLREQGVLAVQEIREQIAAQAPGWATRPAGLKQFMRERFIRSTAAGLLGMANGLRTEPDRVAELASRLRRDGTRCQVITGANDDAWPVPDQRAMAAQLGASFDLIPEAGHSPNVEQPARLLEVLLGHWLAG
ncbi:pimeloyl-ACP methyl ester carboxylesterase [Tamaricihabitans halophyticus]|uniref:Pimeloyl-ACP methyl ester carboxylesterase n=1 Tax=Tamaricihabitans halophyticus TaxID=1262583 RepID=A0A4R2QL74_9PSEU|nr:alpha/beta fold hydrolase [Tamaricihabitans halophyticus]TCP49278.1 pimeloyl-ACP methyl ester carboxylesterase [Tamaricihabitans halophyticus]